MDRFALQGTSLNRIWLRVTVITAFAIVTTYLFVYLDDVHTYSLTTTPFVLIGLALSIFLGFRNNGDEIEQPFGWEDNHLPLHAISRTIEISLRQLAGADPADIPSPLIPKDNVLQ